MLASTHGQLPPPGPGGPCSRRVGEGSRERAGRPLQRIQIVGHVEQNLWRVRGAGCSCSCRSIGRAIATCIASATQLQLQARSGVAAGAGGASGACPPRTSWRPSSRRRRRRRRLKLRCRQGAAAKGLRSGIICRPARPRAAIVVEAATAGGCARAVGGAKGGFLVRDVSDNFALMRSGTGRGRVHLCVLRRWNLRRMFAQAPEHRDLSFVPR